jgi:YVTN family beta-propeller protein
MAGAPIDPLLVRRRAPSAAPPEAPPPRPRARMAVVVASMVVLGGVAAGAAAATRDRDSSPGSGDVAGSAPATPTSTTPASAAAVPATTPPTTTPTTTVTTTLAATASPTTLGTLPPVAVSSDQLRMQLADSVGNGISPKSVVATGTGYVLAQNMMYSHTITVYGPDGALVKTLSDEVPRSMLGLAGTGTVRGAPVEAAISADRRHAWISNYSMYGEGFGPEGTDTCSPDTGYDDSYVYRVDLDQLVIDQAVKVGAVPKYVATTPDGRYVLVSNWCSYSLSVIDTSTATEVRRIALDRYPRGIVVSPDSRVAYVTAMGADRIAAVDLQTFGLSWIDGVGDGPRHLLLDPGGRFLHVTLNAEGRIATIDLATRQVVRRAAVGQEPRTMDMSPDGTALYVVAYGADQVVKLRASDLEVLQRVDTPPRPIGVTYERARGRVWVACYSGTILLFDERPS